MSKKATLTDVSSGYSSASTINDNFNALNLKLENTISRDGSTPNQMGGDLDLDSNDLLNAKKVEAEELYLNGEKTFSVGSTPDWKGAWATSTSYVLNDLVSQNGNVYIALEAHTSGTFATDLTNSLWELFASKGATGSGSGDLLASNNLSDLDDAATARSNLGLGTVATTAATAYATAAQGTLADNALPAADLASESEATTGTDNTKYMTPLRTKQAIAAISTPSILVIDSKTNGSNGGTIPSGTWTTRTLNTVSYSNLSGASLSSNAVTLPAGTYDIEAQSCAGFVDRWRLRIIGSTSGALLYSLPSYSGSGGMNQTLFLQGRITLASSEAISLQQIITTSRGVSDGGASTGIGADTGAEVFSTLKITEVG